MHQQPQPCGHLRASPSPAKPASPASPRPGRPHLARRWRQALLQELHRQLVGHAVQRHVVHHCLNELRAVLGELLAPRVLLAPVACGPAGRAGGLVGGWVGRQVVCGLAGRLCGWTGGRGGGRRGEARGRQAGRWATAGGQTRGGWAVHTPPPPRAMPANGRTQAPAAPRSHVWLRARPPAWRRPWASPAPCPPSTHPAPVGARAPAPPPAPQPRPSLHPHPLPCSHAGACPTPSCPGPSPCPRSPSGRSCMTPMYSK